MAKQLECVAVFISVMDFDSNATHDLIAWVFSKKKKKKDSKVNRLPIEKELGQRDKTRTYRTDGLPIKSGRIEAATGDVQD